MRILDAIVMGLGATACIDLWVAFLRRAFGVRSLDYCLLGRWILHMPGRLVHDRIADARAKGSECAIGWIAHYSIGVAFALLFVLLMGKEWLARPTVLPAAAFGMATVVVPFVTIQPGIGLGIASSRSPRPNAARLKSAVTHAVFGLGLYLTGLLLNLSG